MPGRSKQKSLDITKTGPMTGRVLQDINNAILSGISPEFQQFSLDLEQNYTPTSLYDASAHAQQDVMSPLSQQQTRTGEQDYWGRSYWDTSSATEAEFSQLGDMRAENQPWYSKLVNGGGKAGVFAVTAALETAGLLYGAGHSILEATGAIEDNGKSWLQDLWDNPITNILQSTNEASEEYMPNYYTRDEQENPWGHIFSANFLGDKLLKNFGFMVGAFYGGMPASAGIGKLGTMGVKAARNAAAARAGGMARRFGELTADYSDNVLGKVGQYGREIAGLSDETAASIGAKYGDDVTGLYRKLAKEGLTEGERGQKMLEGLDKINKIANATRATTQTIGVIGSAINEGAIEALNNSKDWAEMRTREENDAYQQALAEIEQQYGGTEKETALKMRAAEEHQKKLAAIEKGRAEVGNADLLMNLPILLASNAYQLGRLYTRGFDTTSRGMTRFGKNLNSTRREMGSFWNGHKLSGSLKEGTLASDKKTWKGVLSALSKSNTEGMEELTQKMAQDAAGNAVDNAIARYMSAGNSEEAKTNVDDYIAGMGKAIADNLQDPKAWEEYMIGAVSSMVGMPVFGSQTKNAYLGKGKLIGLQGGFVGNFKEYKDAMKRENEVANYLNKRVKEPEFKAYYDNLKKHFDYDKWMEEVTVDENGKLQFKDLELENFYQDINMAASSGHLEEFKQLVGYNQDYTDAELEDIVKLTSKEVSPEQQRKADEDRKAYLEGAIQTATKNNEDALVEDFSKELEEVNKRLQDDESGVKKYEKKLEGPFIDRNGQMNVTDPDKMREILERNRQNLLQGIDDYLKIRNDIDIETDGRLDDKQIATLTMMRGHILDYDKRSAEMTEDLVNSLLPVQGFLDMLDKTEGKKLEEAQKELEAAQEELKNASAENKKDKEEAVYTAMKKVYLANQAVQSNKNLLKLVEPVEATRSEQKALNKGYGRNDRGKTYTDEYGTERNITMEEAQAVLANPINASRLKAFVGALGLDKAATNRLISEIDDLSTVAAMKKEYNNRVREYMNDPTLINEAYQRIDDRIKQKDLDNKASELSLRIQGVKNMTELDQLLRENNAVGDRVIQTALQKAKQEGNNDVKNLINDFEKGQQFFMSFQNQVSRLAPDLNQMLSQAAITSWEEALADNLNVYDRFIEHMGESADLLEQAGNKRAADALRKVMKDLDDAKKASSTNKNVAKPSKDTDEPKEKKSSKKDGEKKDKKSGMASFAAAAKKEKEREEGEKKDSQPGTPGKAAPIDFDTLKNDIIAELRNSSSQKSDIMSLSKPLRDSIDEWHTDPSHERITDMTLRQWLQEIQDEKWKDSAFEREIEDPEDDYEEWKENRGEEMSKETQGNFKSGYQSEFSMRKEGGRYIEYAEPYPGDDEQHKKVRQILKDFLAYDFVDHNWLGYAAKAYEDGEVPVYFMKSTVHGVNQPNRPVTFLAIELTPAVRRSIQKWVYNETKGKGKADISAGVHPVEINGKQYQIVGVLSINSEENVSPEIAEAFEDLQQKLHDNLHEKLVEEKKRAKEEGREQVSFIMDDTLSSKITKIFTGRLEKYNDADDIGDNVSLFTFMTSQQDGREDRKTSLEWNNGVPFRFGVIVNRDLKMPPVGTDEVVETPNGAWCQKKGNNGAILLFVPKADGHLYPLRCTRRSVGTWLDDTDDIDGTHQDGRALLEDLMNPESPVKNGYLDRIIELIKVLTDDSDTYSFGQKLDAKYRLASFFTFGRKNPIQLDVATMEVILELEGKEPIVLNADNLHDNVLNFFDFIKDNDRIRFTLPAPATSNSSNTNPDSNIDSRDVIMSGVLEIGLRGFYNFNANVIVEPINGKGVVVEAKTAPEDGGSFVPNDYRGDDRSYTINGEKKDYHISYEEGVTKVTYQDGTIPSDDEQNIVITLESLNNDNNSKETALMLVEKIKQDLGVKWNKAQKQLITDALSDTTSGLYTVFTSGGPMIYDSKAQEIFFLSNKKGQELMGDLKSKVMNYLQHHNAEIMKAAKQADEAPEGNAAIQDKFGPNITDYSYGAQDGLPTFYGTIPSTGERIRVEVDEKTNRYTIWIDRKLPGEIGYTPGKGINYNVLIDGTEEEYDKILKELNLPKEFLDDIPKLHKLNKNDVRNNTDTKDEYLEKKWGIKYGHNASNYKQQPADAPKAPINPAQIKRETPAGSDAGNRGNLFKGVTLDGIKDKKETDSLFGVIASAYSNGTKQDKAKANKIFDALKSVDENFGIAMSEEELKKQVKDLLGMKKGWKEKLDKMVDDLSKCK